MILRSAFLSRLVAVAVLAGAQLACSSNHEAAHAGAAHHWGYADAAGPEHWCDLDPANRGCADGKEQSPIDIVPASAVAEHSASLALHDAPSDFGVANNGHTVQATLRPGSGTCNLTLDGVGYDLQQFHVHTPSEHEIDGKHSPLELHFVHKAADGSLAVVGVMVERGAANAELEKVWKLAPPHAAEGGVAAAVDIAKILPATHVNFRYAGSLTTPPCSEKVQWIVMETPITMSAEQIARIQALFVAPEFPHGNARPVQPLGQRKVVIDPGS
jgi:carbonic anhydrase